QLLKLAQAEGAGYARRQSIKAALEGFPEFGLFDGPVGRHLPLTRPDFEIEMVNPFARLLKNLRVFEFRFLFRLVLAQAADFSVMVNDFMLEDADEPGPFGRLPGKLVIRLQSGE